MMNHSDFYEDQNIVQKLNFSTPQKNKGQEWRLGTTKDNISRNLFDSHKKNQSSEQLRLIMPLIIVDVPKNRENPANYFEKINEIIENN